MHDSIIEYDIHSLAGNAKKKWNLHYLTDESIADGTHVRLPLMSLNVKCIACFTFLSSIVITWHQCSMNAECVPFAAFRCWDGSSGKVSYFDS